MANSLKRPRPLDADKAAEHDDDGGLVKLVHRRLGDVEKLVTHVKNLEDEVRCESLPEEFLELSNFACTLFLLEQIRSAIALFPSEVEDFCVHRIMVQLCPTKLWRR